MIDLKEQLIESQTVFAGKILKVRLDRVLLPDGREASREVVGHPGAVAIVPVTNDGKVILVRQYRYPVEKVMLEIPAGKLDKGEKPESCALRELEEETGFVARRLEKLTSYYTAPGFTDEILHVFLASDLEQTEQKLDGDEFIGVEYYNRDELKVLLADDSVKDAKTLIGLMLAGY
jgi:ADP-ribose pyrophosphatase